MARVTWRRSIPEEHRNPPQGGSQNWDHFAGLIVGRTSWFQMAAGGDRLCENWPVGVTPRRLVPCNGGLLS